MVSPGSSLHGRCLRAGGDGSTLMGCPRRPAPWQPLSCQGPGRPSLPTTALVFHEDALLALSPPLGHTALSTVSDGKEPGDPRSQDLVLEISPSTLGIKVKFGRWNGRSSHQKLPPKGEEPKKTQRAPAQPLCTCAAPPAATRPLCPPWTPNPGAHCAHPHAWWFPCWVFSAHSFVTLDSPPFPKAHSRLKLRAPPGGCDSEITVKRRWNETLAVLLGEGGPHTHRASSLQDP